MALRWYVVHAYSDFEHRVSEGLRERIKRAGLESKFGEILVPTEEVVEMRDGQKRKSERKFFPGYVLVQMEMDEETWHLVKRRAQGDGLHRRHAARSRPRSRDKEAEPDPAARRRKASRSRVRRSSSSPARWCGSSTGHSTTSTAWSRDVNYEKSRLQVAVQIFGRSTPVELDFSQVEKA